MSKVNDLHRSDRHGAGRNAFEETKKILFALHPEICPLCGKPLEYDEKGNSLYKAPHPLSIVVDHIIPLSTADKSMMTPSQASSTDNCQLTHFICNRQKGAKLIKDVNHKAAEKISNRILEQHNDWAKYRAQ